MNHRRGAANLETYNRIRTNGLAAALESELRKCVKRKMQFASISELAVYLQNKTGIHRTTLLNRNPSYKRRLENYLILQNGNEEILSDEEAPIDLLKKRLRAKSLEVTNLKSKIVALEAKLLSVYSPLQSAIQCEHFEKSENDQKFADTAMILVSVLARLSESLSVDFANQEILDLAARPSERVIAGRKRASSFIQWLAKNKHLLLEANKE